MRPSRARAIFFQVLSLLLLTKLISGALLDKESSVDQKQTLSSDSALLAESLEEKTLNLQGKIALSSLFYLRKESKKYTSTSFPLESFEQSIKDSFARGTFVENKKREVTDDLALRLYLKKYAFAKHLKIDSAQEDYLERILAQKTESKDLKKLQSLIARLGKTKDLLPNKEEKKLLKRLGLFGHLLLAETSDQEKSVLFIKKTSESFFLKLALGIIFFILFFTASLICFFIYLFAILNKKLLIKFRTNKELSDYALEIFCLYLGSMFLLPYLISYLMELGILKNTLLANVLGISPLIFLIFWPRLFGASLKDIRDLLGIRFTGFKDFLVGPSAYLAYWLILILVLALYALLMQSLGVNSEDSAHPVVPVLTSSKDKSSIFYVFILAVIIAPLIEEVMFRGALYTWLRARLGVASSVLSSSLIFAAVHPQGAVGIVPLTFIGILLALLREWRNGLSACILAHACFNAGTLSMVLFFFR